MNILILSWRGPKHPLSGGAEIVTHEYAKYWVEQGYDVTLFTSTFPNALENETIDGVKIVRRGRQLLGVQIEAYKWFKKLDNKPDIIIDHFHGIPFFTPLYTANKKISFIHEVGREIWFHNYLPFPINYLIGLAGYVSEPLIHALLYKKVKYITVSNSTKRDLMKFGVSNKNIYVLNNGIETINVKFKKENTKTIMYLGALAKDKGVEDAIDVFSKLSNKDQNLHFWIVGKGSTTYIAHLVSICKKLEIEDKVRFWGFVDNRKKFELLSKSHILINPSKREGWGLVNIEANASGTPVFGYEVPGMVDSVVSGKTGVLVDKDDTVSLAEEIYKTLTDTEKYNFYQQNAIKWSKKFNWKSSKEKSIKILKEL